MRTLCKRTEVVESREVAGKTYEVCALLIGTHNENSGELTITLDSFVRAVNVRGPDQQYCPKWLPHADEIRHSAEVDDAWDETQIVFKEWAAKVRNAIPPAAQAFAESLRAAPLHALAAAEPLVQRSAFRREV